MTNLRASYSPYLLEFKRPAKTSRDTLRTRPVWFLKIWSSVNPSVFGIGECAPISGLSIEDVGRVPEQLEELVNSISQNIPFKSPFPSVRFAYEMALEDLSRGGKRLFVENDFVGGSHGIQINGLVWMGDFDFMAEQVEQKIEAGFKCIKIKIGALDWKREFELLKGIRDSFGDSIELRVDANGGFTMENVRNVLQSLASINIHSIEQPIQQGQIESMAQLCREEIVPIALDEELIGIDGGSNKATLLDQINPQYIILKPSLIGGFASSDEWINLAEERNIGWWATSALESNIGLNAIAQWLSDKQTSMPQGLGTGSLYTNNIEGPLQIKGERLFHDPSRSWDNIFGS